MTRPRSLLAAGATGAAVLAFAMSACSANESDDSSAGRDGSTAPPVAFGHVHGLGVNPADGRLYVASHLGVFRRAGDGFERITDRWQDTMAFTVTGPDTFLASGHPDLRETDRPVHLGLIQTTDAARTWKAVSLGGKADFHALEPAPDRIYGYDSNHGVLKVTRDKRQWTDIARIGVIDLAVNPKHAQDLLLTDNRTRLQRLTNKTRLRTVANAPRLAFIDWPRPNLLVGIAPDGTVHRSRDSGRSWQTLGSVGGAPEALDVTADLWSAATQRGVLTSADQGRTWTLVAGQPGMDK